MIHIEKQHCVSVLRLVYELLFSFSFPPRSRGNGVNLNQAHNIGSILEAYLYIPGTTHNENLLWHQQLIVSLAYFDPKT